VAEKYIRAARPVSLRWRALRLLYRCSRYPTPQLHFPSSQRRTTHEREAGHACPPVAPLDRARSRRRPSPPAPADGLSWPFTPSAAIL
jgi:hypothetical protein